MELFFIQLHHIAVHVVSKCGQVKSKLHTSNKATCQVFDSGISASLQLHGLLLSPQPFLHHHQTKLSLIFSYSLSSVFPPPSPFCLLHLFYHVCKTLRILPSVVNCLSSLYSLSSSFLFLFFLC